MKQSTEDTFNQTPLNPDAPNDPDAPSPINYDYPDTHILPNTYGIPGDPDTPKSPKRRILAYITVAAAILVGICGIYCVVNASQSESAICSRDMRRIQKITEKFLRENPEPSDTFCTPEDILEEMYIKFHKEYMQNDFSYATWNDEYLVYLTKTEDPWGRPYQIIFRNDKPKEDSQEYKGHIRVLIRSKGPFDEGYEDVYGSSDDDDRITLLQVDKGLVASTSWISKDRQHYWGYGFNRETNMWGDLNYAFD